MDTRTKAHKASLHTAAASDISIRAAEPTDAAAMSALMGSEGLSEEPHLLSAYIPPLRKPERSDVSKR
jgi:hypothetical protein